MSIVAGIEPRDQLESMLASQMAAVHIAMMKAGKLLLDLTTQPNAVARPVHEKAMPVILTTDEERD